MLKIIVNLIRVIVPVLILFVGYTVYSYLMSTGPKPKKRPPVDRTPVVEVQSVKKQSYSVTLSTSGIVKAQSETNLVVEVAGKVKKLSSNFREGAYVNQGEILLELDDSDVRDAISIAKSNSASTKASLQQLNQEEKNTHNKYRLTKVNLRSVQKNLNLARRNSHNVERNRGAIKRNIILVKKNLLLAKKNLLLTQRNLKLGQKELQRMSSLWEKRLIARNAVESEKQKVIQLNQAIIQQQQVIVQQEQQLAQQDQSLIQQDQNTLSQEQKILQQQQAVNQQQQNIENIKGQLATFKSRRDGLKAKLASSKTQLKQQQRNLERTKVTAPFAGRILAKRIGKGQYLSPNTVAGSLYPADFVEVDMPLSLKQFELLDLPHDIERNTAKQQQFPVELTLPYEQNGKWNGYITGTRATLDNQSRQIIVIARLDNPFITNAKDSTSAVSLRVGQYLNASIKGKTFHNVYLLPSSAVRQNREILLVENNKVFILAVKTVWNTESTSVIQLDTSSPQAKIQDLDNKQIITTPFPQATEGMSVLLPEQKKKHFNSERKKIESDKKNDPKSRGGA
ncbi:MAG: HlyD family efflux transporter periplasmic adaptor subunit [Cocleimonas sp.]|nr:HlyD family efflux transporter periplasmic adaptor subunit [Cocleimonas sp.]